MNNTRIVEQLLKLFTVITQSPPIHISNSLTQTQDRIWLVNLVVTLRIFARMPYTGLGSERADNYHDISYHDNIALSYRIEYWDLKIVIIVSYRNMIKFQKIISYRLDFWDWALKNIISSWFLILISENYCIVSKIDKDHSKLTYHIMI